MAADDTTPWEPPLAGTEVEHLLGALDRLRATFRWKAGGLDAEWLNSRISSSDLTLGGLLKHLACVEDVTFTVKLAGVAPGEPWQRINWDENPHWDFTSASDNAPEELYAIWDGAVTRSRTRVNAALAAGGVRPSHRARRSATRGRRRTGGRGPASRMAVLARPRAC